MVTHLFKVGSAVSLNSEGGSATLPSRYVVEALMPPVGAFLQYRIKSEGEGFRRVVVEHQLSMFGAAAKHGPARTGAGRGEED